MFCFCDPDTSKCCICRHLNFEAWTFYMDKGSNSEMQINIFLLILSCWSKYYLSLIICDLWTLVYLCSLYSSFNYYFNFWIWCALYSVLLNFIFGVCLLRLALFHSSSGSLIWNSISSRDFEASGFY